jgi:hypothetical protein
MTIRCEGLPVQLKQNSVPDLPCKGAIFSSQPKFEAANQRELAVKVQRTQDVRTATRVECLHVK